MKPNAFSSKPRAWFKTKVLSFFSLFFFSFLLIGCGGSSSDDSNKGGTTTNPPNTPTNATKSSTKDLTSFTFNSGVIKDYVINGTDVNITIDYHSKDLTPIVTHTGVSYSPNSSTAINFAPIPATYTITAEDDTTKDYKITVKRAFEVSDEEELADAIDEITNAISFDSSSLSYITIFVKNDITLTTSKTINENWGSRDIVFENNSSNLTTVTIGNLTVNGNNTVKRIGVNINPPVPCASSITDTNICNVEEFNTKIRNNPYKEYKLLVDIDLSGYSDWTPIGSYSDPFTGKLDGNGHTISGLKFKNTNNNTQFIGLFGYIDGAEIKNLKVQVANSADTINLTLTNDQYFGVIAGYAVNGATLTKTTVTSAAPLAIHKSGTSSLYAGGVVGLANGATISKSASSITLGIINSATAFAFSSASAYAGGIAGVTEQGAIDNSYATGNISANSDLATAGGIAGYNDGSVVSKSYASGAILVDDSIDAYAGGIVGANINGRINNSTALNPSITAIGSSHSFVQRIAYDRGASSYLNNFAFEAIIINIASVLSNLNGADGLNKNDTALKTQATWSDDNDNGGLDWNFDTIWKFDKNERPVLQR
jgi:hypothetical protein